MNRHGSLAWIAVLVVFAFIGVIPAPASASTGVYTISGRVFLGSASTPAGLEDVIVTAFRQPDGERMPESVRTNASGEYTIDDVLPGDYSVRFFYRGSDGFASQWWKNRTSADVPDRVAVSDRPVTGLDMVLPKQVTVSGTLSFGVSGSHPAGASGAVTWDRLNAGNWESGPVYGPLIGADGAYSLTLDPGTYRLRFSAGRMYQGGYWGGGGFPSSAVPIELRSSTTGVDYTAPPSGTITGRVLLGSSANPAGSEQVRVKYSACWEGCQYNSSGSVLTDGRGVYTIPELTNGSYSLDFEYVAGPAFQNASGPTVVVSNESLTPSVPDVVLKPSATITGRVTLGSRGAAKAGQVTVSAYSTLEPAFPRASVTTDAQGTYTIRGLPTGSYRVEYRPTTAGDSTTRWWPDALSQSTATDIAVSTTVVTRDIDLPAGAALSGGAITTTAAPIPGVEVTAYGSVGSAEPFAKISTRTAADGSFAFRGLSPANYRVEFSDSGYSSGPSISRQWLGGTVAEPQGRTFALREGDDIRLPASTLYRLGSASGAVTCPACGELDPTYLRVTVDSRNSRGEWVTGGGRAAGSAFGLTYVFDSLYPGHYRVTAAYAKNTVTGSATAEFSISENERVTRDLVLVRDKTVLTLPSGAPIGALDLPTTKPGVMTVTGWAIDPDTVDPVAVHLYVDGVGQAVVASGYRPDVARVYPAYGETHGFSATLTGQSPGNHRVCAYGINVGPPAGNTALGCRIVSVPSGSPVGVVDFATGTPGGIAVGGWAMDPDADGPIDVHVYVDGVGKAVRAAESRPDVGNYYVGYPNAYTSGYSSTAVGLSGGAHQVCVYAINRGVGENSLLGCRMVQIPSGSPFGALDSAVAKPGSIVIGGWTIDPDTTDPIDAHVYIDGVGRAVRASDTRPDVAAVYPGYGAAHGFSIAVPGLSGGAHQVCVYGINRGPGANASLGCRTVTTPTGAPFGSVDQVTGGVGAISIGGWTIDPDTADSITTHLYVDGRFARAVGAAESRPDVAAAYPGYGAAHGFSTSYGAVSPGPHQVCIYAINQAGPGGNPQLGCRTVTVR